MTTATLGKELLDLERQYWGALKNRDLDTATRLTDFPCIVTGPQGVGHLDEGAFAELVENAPYDIRRVDVSDDVEVRLLRDDVAVVAYKIHEELTVDGKPVTIEAADSSTWVRRNGTWLCAHHTEAITGDPFGRDRAGATSTAPSRGSADGIEAENEQVMRPRQDRRIEKELREDYERWFDESAAKDIDAVMAHIADDAVTYEHEAPLQYQGVDAIRQVCQRGFDAMQGEFRWDVPDLKVLTSGDLAVAWGLNHMRARTPDGKTVDMWSRGTRVHRKLDGNWCMVHQHVSFPYDPETGAARLDLKP
jgi:ketosteroid isomerase-like protein